MSSGQTLIGTTPLAIPSLGEFEARRQHAYNKIAYDLPVKRGRFLDIGCGMGNALVAALQAGFSLAVGVDRSLSEFAHTMPLPFDEICAKYNLVAEQALLVEGDIFAFGFQPGSFDAVMMLDSIEHVPAPHEFISYAYRMAKPGGYFLLDTCPLYYSTKGHHLWSYLSEPWAHLRLDFRNFIETRKVDSWSMDRFLELNRITHDEILAQCHSCGFELIREHRAIRNSESAEQFEKIKSQLDWSLGFTEQQFFEDWVLLVLRRPVVGS